MFGIGDDECVLLQSAAKDRVTYLQRPDFGRQLSESSRASLIKKYGDPTADDQASIFDLAFVLVDGLSALAIERNALAFLSLACQTFEAEGLRIAPFSIVEQGRVAIGDEIGELLRARLVIVMIGERPGLSSPDSMGLYITWHPKRGLTDESRNCISNIHPRGLSYEAANGKLHYLVTQARARQLTGVRLKDETISSSQAPLATVSNFLLD